MSGYAVKILADSVSPEGVRLTTVEVTFPRFILAEQNTHRMMARNTASSRAIPVSKRIEMVEADPFIPAAFGKNRKGMQSVEELQGADADAARNVWQAACSLMVSCARDLERLGVHKQYANRLLEPFCWITQIITATEWGNYFNLRCDPAAQPEMQTIAYMIRDAYYAATPTPLQMGEWHLPLIFQEDVEEAAKDVYYSGDNTADMGTIRRLLCKVSAGRCARVSYLTHDGKRDLQADLDLHDRLVASGHMSPTEHQATPADAATWYGNLRGWQQYRKMLPNENRTEYTP